MFLIFINKRGAKATVSVFAFSNTFSPEEANDVEEISHIFLWYTILISIYATRKGQAGFKSPKVEFMSKWGLTAISPKRDFYNTSVLQTESEEEWEWDERLLSS